MEGKAALFKRFADIDAWPVCIDSQDVDEIVRTVQLIAPVYGGINLEDISAPRCFEVEARLRELLDINVLMCDSRTAWDPQVIKESLFDKPIIG
jgi:malate dehydrogenase (oxaloacetate-decarboxylating)